MKNLQPHILQYYYWKGNLKNKRTNVSNSGIQKGKWENDENVFIYSIEYKIYYKNGVQNFTIIIEYKIYNNNRVENLTLIIKYRIHNKNRVLNLIHKIYSLLIGLTGRLFANGPGDLGSIPRRIIPRTFKMVLDTFFPHTQQYKMRIKGIVEQSREKSSAFPIPRCCSYCKGSLLVANFTVL